LLNDGEEIVLDRHPHWSFLIGAVAMAVTAFLITVVLVPSISNLFGSAY